MWKDYPAPRGKKSYCLDFKISEIRLVAVWGTIGEKDWNYLVDCEKTTDDSVWDDSFNPCDLESCKAQAISIAIAKITKIRDSAENSLIQLRNIQQDEK